jgi:hypothetical protein
VHTAEKSLTFERTDAYGDEICYQYGAGEFRINMNGEPEAISSCGEFRDVVRESFDVIGRSTDPTVDYRLDAHTMTACLMTGAVVAASGSNEVTESGYL